MTTHKLFVIIVSWNSKKDLSRCLDALLGASGAFEVVVVDNASTDNSVEMVRQKYPQVNLLVNEQNLGYTGGNNVGLRYALDRGADYILLLNDDAIVEQSSIAQLLEATIHYPEAGFLGPAVYSWEEKDTLLSAGGFFNERWQVTHRNTNARAAGAMEVDFLSGCALLLKREVISDIGLLDERFFAYHEDVDWCYQAKQAGFKLLVVPEAKIWHPDTRQRDANSPTLAYYMTRNTLLFLSKHQLGRLIILRKFITYLLRWANWSLNPKWRHKHKQRDNLLRAVIDFARGRFGRAEWIG